MSQYKIALSTWRRLQEEKRLRQYQSNPLTPRADGNPVRGFFILLHIGRETWRKSFENNKLIPKKSIFFAQTLDKIRRLVL